MEHFCDFQQPWGAQPLAATPLHKLTLLHCGQRPIQPNQQCWTLYTVKASNVGSADAKKKKKKKGWDFWQGGSLHLLPEMFPETSAICALLLPAQADAGIAAMHEVVRNCQSGRSSGSASGSYGGERIKPLLILYCSCWPNTSCCSL